MSDYFFFDFALLVALGLSGAWVRTEAANDFAAFVDDFWRRTFDARLAISFEDFSLLAIVFSYGDAVKVRH